MDKIEKIILENYSKRVCESTNKKNLALIKDIKKIEMNINYIGWSNNPLTLHIIVKH